MSSVVDDRSLIRCESKIIWLRDVNTMPYVREFLNYSCRKRIGKMKYKGWEIVGYAELEKNAETNIMNGLYIRRGFWLKEYDRANQPDGIYKVGCPVEAVDPLTISPKIIGEMTDRAWGKLLN